MRKVVCKKGVCKLTPQASRLIQSGGGLNAVTLHYLVPIRSKSNSKSKKKTQTGSGNKKPQTGLGKNKGQKGQGKCKKASNKSKSKPLKVSSKLQAGGSKKKVVKRAVSKSKSSKKK